MDPWHMIGIGAIVFTVMMFKVSPVLIRKEWEGVAAIIDSLALIFTIVYIIRVITT